MMKEFDTIRAIKTHRQVAQTGLYEAKRFIDVLKSYFENIDLPSGYTVRISQDFNEDGFFGIYIGEHRIHKYYYHEVSGKISPA